MFHRDIMVLAALYGHGIVPIKIDEQGKNGDYFPQCDNRWNDRLCPKQHGEKEFCDECENTKWTRLDVKEEPPEYKTKTGRKKKRDSVIGILHGSKNTLTGIVDVAMVASMYNILTQNQNILTLNWTDAILLWV